VNRMINYKNTWYHETDATTAAVKTARLAEKMLAKPKREYGNGMDSHTIAEKSIDSAETYLFGFMVEASIWKGFTSR